MKYELEKLDEIISVSLQPRNILEQKNRAAYLNRCRASLFTETERIKKQFLEEIFNSGDEWKNKLYIHQHQMGIIRASDQLNTHLQSGGAGVFDFVIKGRPIAEFFEGLYIYLEEILYFLESHFKQYFDLECKVPALYLKRVAREIKPGCEQLRSLLQERNVNEDLVDLICRAFKGPLDKSGKLSFMELKNLKEMLQAILQDLPSTGDNISNLLLHLNFNSKDYFDHYVKLHINYTNGINNTQEKIDYYSLQMKMINQVQREPGIALRPSAPSILDQIGSWISEELYFLEKRCLSGSTLTTGKNDELAGTEKIQTSLSVAHLSLGVKLLMDAGVIINDNATEMMRIVSRNFSTVKKESISEDSLRNKAYNVESGTVEGMKEVIIKLMNLVRGY